jgi:hypothetical protein
MNPEYIQAAVTMAPQAASAIGAIGGPVGFVGRVAGFGPDELDAGVPGWAWFVLGAGLGITAGLIARPHVEKWV